MTTKILVRPRGLPSYPVWIGPGALRPALKALPHKTHAVLFHDSRLRNLAGKSASLLHRHFSKVDILDVRGGESLKTLEAVGIMASKLTRLGARKNVILVALGGGSVGDAIGFLASVYLRGVPWVSLPTTLLAQVDSSIGGKTAVNLREGKNLVGAFHHPLAVICDPHWLNTLPRQEIMAAMGEVLKYGLAFDPPLLNNTLRQWMSLESGSMVRLEPLVRDCLRWKSRIVGTDPYERSGQRRLLNLGHTFGHALETLMAPHLRHGEAVFHGLHAALHLSILRGHMKLDPSVRKLLEFFETRPLPPKARSIGAPILLRQIHRDKKSTGGRTTFILLKGVSRPVEDSRVPDSLIAETWTLLTRQGVAF
ncbi:MAG: 3-dehydroquinate synthase family protein [Planctomycetota bacterium]